jgi:nicotinamidase-related amidase
MSGVRDYSTGELKHNVVALAKAAKALTLPIIVTTTARDSMWGPTFPELVEALPGISIIDRSSVNAFDDPKVAQAITATGRKKLIFAGISLEVCAAFPAITAAGKGLDAYVAVDASGTFSETRRQVGLLRMLQAGVILSDYATLMVEILKDNTRPEAGSGCDAGGVAQPGHATHTSPLHAPSCRTAPLVRPDDLQQATWRIPMAEETIISDGRVRRAAKRAGLMVMKTRWRRNTCDNCGGYMLLEPVRNIIVAGQRFDLSPQDVLDRIERFISTS